MTQPRPPRPHDATERRILDLNAAKARHARRVTLARLEREVAALGDPAPPSAGEQSHQRYTERMRGILERLEAMDA